MYCMDLFLPVSLALHSFIPRFLFIPQSQSNPHLLNLKEMVIAHDGGASLDTRAVYNSLATSIGFEPLDSKRLNFKGQDPVVPSPHRIGDATAAALGLLGTAMASILHHRSGILDEMEISIEDAIHQLTAAFYTKVNDVGMLRFFEDPHLFSDSDFYQTKDGRYVFLLLTYPELRNVACEVLNCPPGREFFAREIQKWDAFELESKVYARGGCCTAVRSREEWRNSSVGKASMAKPLISIVKVGDSDPEPFSSLPNQVAGQASPLDGFKVLDNSHVIAGPMASRICAEHGAEVLHMSSPEHPDSPAMVNETCIGKRNAFCDLASEKGRAGFWKLLKEADIYVNSYLSLEKKGFSVPELIKARPGLICLDYHGWDHEGEWAQRGGFDQLACSATGFALEEAKPVEKGSFPKPSLPPTYLLNDYLAAILGASGVVSALHKRAKEGGSYRVHLDLARVCTWVQDLGSFQHKDIDTLPPVNHEDQTPMVKTVEGPTGTTQYLPSCLHYKQIGSALTRGAEPLGASRFHWK